MEKPIIVQKLKREENNSFDIAYKYYGIISIINNLNLTEREIQLVSFSSIKGSVSYKHLREEFCEKYNTSPATINNIISKLKKIGVLIKDNGKIKTHPAILLKFNSDIRLFIDLKINE